MIYVLIFISLTLAVITAFQFLYLFFLERVQLEQKKRIRELESYSKHLEVKLNEAERELAEKSEIICSFDEDEEDVWADVIE